MADGRQHACRQGSHRSRDQVPLGSGGCPAKTTRVATSFLSSTDSTSPPETRSIAGCNLRKLLENSDKKTKTFAYQTRSLPYRTLHEPSAGVSLKNVSLLREAAARRPGERVVSPGGAGPTRMGTGRGGNRKAWSSTRRWQVVACRAVNLLAGDADPRSSIGLEILRARRRLARPTSPDPYMTTKAPEEME